MLPVYDALHNDIDDLGLPATAAVATSETSAVASPSDDIALSASVPPTLAAPTGPDPCPESSGPTEEVLDEDILKFLGEAPNKDKKYGQNMQSDIASRWEHIATSGLSKEVRKTFQENYLTPGNCGLIDPPMLNPEVKAAISEALQKKDTAILNKQKEIATAISCLGQAIQRALSKDTRDAEIIKLLIDAGRIVCDVQHTESTMRRGFISTCIKKEVKDHLNDTQIDKWLFGEKLAETLKAAKSIHKSGSEIRLNYANTKAPPKNKTINPTLNSKSPAATSRLPPLSAGRRFEGAASAQPPLPPRRRPAAQPQPPQRTQQRPRAPRR